MKYAVETYELGRRFKVKGSPDKVALHGVNLQIQEGELFGLLGPNGAGKSTLIKILSTLLYPSEGRALVRGHDVEKEAQKLRWQISMVSGGETSGFGIMSVYENLWMFSQLYGLSTKEAKTRIYELLEVVGLKESAKTRVSQLSTGMRQKMNFVRGFLTEPKVLFLDEPTLGLDVDASRTIRAYLKEWMRARPDTTLILTTHYMAEADELCDRMAIIDSGTLQAIGTPAQLKRQVVPETVLELELEGTGDGAAQLLRSLAGVVRVLAEADPKTNRTKLTVLVEGDGVIPQVLSQVQAEGHPLASFHKAEPTLEDVFLKLVGRSLGDAAALAGD